MTRDVVKIAAAELRGIRSTPALPLEPGANPGRVGTAVDFMVRVALCERPCPTHSMARNGAGQMGSREMAVSAFEAIEHALADARIADASRRDLDAIDWDTLARVSLMLAGFEITGRYGLPPDAVKALRRPPPDWRAWADVLSSPEDRSDLTILGAAAIADLLDLRASGNQANPVFTQSAALGGADADLLTASGLLLDLKSTTTTKVCSRRDVWQVVGYALADTHDDLGITAVGLSAVRWRTRVQWDLDVLLQRLAVAPINVEQARDEFAEVASRARWWQREQRSALKVRKRIEVPHRNRVEERHQERPGDLD